MQAKEEQKLMLNLINPSISCLFTENTRMLKSHMKSAIETGVPKEKYL